MKKGLLDERPLLILPTLATKIGLNESIILQQIHYWCEISTNIHYGKAWVFNTYEEWQEQFPFFSQSTIRRTIDRLFKMGILEKGNFNKLGIDRTNWYTINYTILSFQIEQSIRSKRTDDDTNLNSPSVQIEQTNNHRVLQESTTKTTSKKEIKTKHKDFVYLTDEELKLLQDKFGNDTTNKAIEKLDNYKGATGKRYKSDYRAILSWVIDSLNTKKGNKKTESLPDWYSDRGESKEVVNPEEEKRKLLDILKREK
jgi:hypothetical protein